MVIQWSVDYNKRANRLAKWVDKLDDSDTEKFTDDLIAFDDVAKYYILDILSELGIEITPKP
mgnify:FL=1